MSCFYCVETSPNHYGGHSFYSLNATSNVLGQQSSPMYNSRTPSPLEYQFPNNVNSNTFYGQSSLTKVHTPRGKITFF